MKTRSIRPGMKMQTSGEREAATASSTTLLSGFKLLCNAALDSKLSAIYSWFKITKRASNLIMTCVSERPRQKTL